MRLSNPTTTTLTVLLVLFTLLESSFAAKSTAASFCKCICFNNSTIIALNPPGSSTQSSSLHKFDIRSGEEPAPAFSDEKRRAIEAQARADGSDTNKSPSRPHHKLTCADCTRAFCLDYNLPICKGAREEDVFTTCFQRDSLKDETVVVVFIFATAGLLAWAIVKPWIDRLRERNSFSPLSQHDGSNGNNNSLGIGREGRRPGGRPQGSASNGVGSAAAGGSRSGIARGSTTRSTTSKWTGGSGPRPGSSVHPDEDALDIVSGSGAGSGAGAEAVR
ncbi:hypothetical protein HRR83_001774 [Exophiala dermatitidis]|uniref:Uncharacterized protein n=2 Tax=Exophiala dermatitidis TaxID=5970 RepID=H6C5B5_EXODN|nr:uncharacterized protein HMPREF1120_06963 [Exophiala dermatitidis NIH/UT8656]KAJ4516442.1 hypothetical protein HRR73_004907 [Exophiala dermatitidis]EHY58962.1 hypothetical protein HMPREF1120_06963 [Exophiala dermatitidis NIH/UT8656]KAJ4523239.1 hypothetical protein HRR75_001640 [Exophiala dermatitidis]KAJ4526577.1 hypothetical protein HRR74_001777 [Exophiala dermatitidis]KAJ4532175.1 hypothetical protein HRR76_007172 [Exophiala dermatitidis]